MPSSEHSKKEDTHRNLNTRIRATRANDPHMRPRREPEGSRRGITTIC